MPVGVGWAILRSRPGWGDVGQAAVLVQPHATRGTHKPVLISSAEPHGAGTAGTKLIPSPLHLYLVSLKSGSPRIVASVKDLSR